MTRLFCFLFFFILLPPTVASAEKLSRAAMAAVYQAQQLMAKEAYPDAALVLEEYLDKNKNRDPQKDFVTVLFTLANIYSIMDKPAQAEPLYRRLLKKDPEFSPGWQNFGAILFDLEQYKQAGDAFAKAWETSGNEDQDKSDTLLYHAAIAYIMAEKPALARPHLEYLVSGKAGEIKQEWVVALFRTYLDLKKNELALNLIRKLIHRDGANPKWWYYLAHLHLQSGKYEEAAEALTIRSYMKETSQKEKILLGNLFQMIGVPGKAAQAYRAAIAKEGQGTKQHSRYYKKLAHAYIAAHKPELALQVLDKAIRKTGQEKLFFLKGQILMAEERWQEAYSAFARASEKNNDGLNHLLAGYSALRAGNHAAAKAHFNRAKTFKKQKEQAFQLLKYIEYYSASL